MVSTAHHAWRIHSSDLPLSSADGCQQQFFPDGLGEGRSTIFQLDSELSYIETKIKPAKDIAIVSTSDFPEPRMVVTLGIRGCSRFVDKGGEMVFREGYTSITTVGTTTGERRYESNKAVSQVRFNFPKTWLVKHFGENKAAKLFDGEGTKLIASVPTNPSALISAQQVLNCNLNREMTRLYMLGSAMTILATELGHLWRERDQFLASFNHTDKLIAHRAREILFEEFCCPPSVEDLAKRVNTNSFKLKKLFHHFFNTTPYGMILDIRMSRAHQLLLSSNFKVSDIAEEVGYQHAGNFTAAFAKYFGVTPKQIGRWSGAPEK